MSTGGGVRRCAGLRAAATLSREVYVLAAEVTRVRPEVPAGRYKSGAWTYRSIPD